MTIRCPYCGRELKCIGGYYSPIFEECSCGGRERAKEAARKRSREIAHEQETCHHEWTSCVQDGVGYFRCTKCGATRL